MVTKKHIDGHAKGAATAPAAPPAMPPAKTGMPSVPAHPDLSANTSAQHAPATRARVAELLGISRTSVRRLEEAGVLHPKVDPESGERNFDMEEVKRVAAERTGDRIHGEPPPAPPPRSEGAVAAAVFRLLDQGMPLVNIVIELGAPPEVIERAAQTWQRLKQLDMSSPSLPAIVAKLTRTVNLLVEQVQQLQASCSGCPLAGIRSRECEQCGSVGLASVEIQCTDCGCRFRRGFWPQPEDGEDE